jgi:hypothetical protein
MGLVVADKNALTASFFGMILGSIIGAVGFVLILVGPVPTFAGFVIGATIGGLLEMAIAAIAAFFGEKIGSKFRLFVVGERSADTASWSMERNRAFVIAENPEEAIKLAEELPVDKCAAEIGLTESQVIGYDDVGSEVGDYNSRRPQKRKKEEPERRRGTS